MFNENTHAVLVVEDDVSVLGMVCRVLQKAHYEVFVASSGDEALKIFDHFRRKIGLVITDIVMPGINGFDLIEKMRLASPRIRSLYMSGYAEHPMFELNELELKRPFLLKPFTPSVLLKKVLEALGIVLPVLHPVQLDRRKN